MLKTTIKASNITNLTDARYFAAWHVDWLGFDLSPEGLKNQNIQEIKEIINWLEGPKIVGELSLGDLNQAVEIIDFLALKNIQVGADAPVEYLNGLKVDTIIKEINVTPITSYEAILEEMETYFNYVDYFLLDFDKSGMDWRAVKQQQDENQLQLQDIAAKHPLFLNVSFSSSEVAEILEMVQPLGLNLKGGLEEKVGFKSFDELDEIFEELEEEEY
jgi:phosphoribosylanthranilate isomerase